MAVPGWMAACAAAGALTSVAFKALSPAKKQRVVDDEEPSTNLADDAGAAGGGGGGEGRGGGQEDGRGRKGVERGSVQGRWIARCTKEAISADLAAGCGCPDA